ncbi:hypothetical protein DFH07DRAFT_146523 [Mycena maculata]|uniref:Uncharacterized protein n=1 Tax=Mycena maculata TaxID=230809 RepID=A0AAD7NSJ1_9AGAR|nr:hypothetical protein DFH07DRAFT_146523 [Mycena maculata]
MDTILPLLPFMHLFCRANSVSQPTTRSLPDSDFLLLSHSCVPRRIYKRPEILLSPCLDGPLVTVSLPFLWSNMLPLRLLHYALTFLLRTCTRPALIPGRRTS